MNKVVVLGLAGCLSLGVVAGQWAFAYRAAQVDYVVYGAGLGDPMAPTAGDAKIAFSVTGSAAQAMFEAMGPDKPDECASADGTRFRARDKDRLSCQRSREGEYGCQFGFDLGSGKSIGGSIC
ncbi:MAG: hypothetical protein V4812_19715 [Pseudomonadota bacterium]